MKSLLLCFFACLQLPTMAAGAGWKGLESLPGHKPVTVLVNEQSRLYYRVTSQDSLQLTVRGPVKLRVISRLDLPSGSKGAVTYRILLREGGTLLDSQSTESSGSSLVRSEDGRALGKARRMTTDIPAGEHRLSLTVQGASALLVRLMQASPLATGQESMVTLTPYDAPRSVLLTEGEKTIPYFSTMAGKPVRLRVVGPTTLELLARLDFDATMRGSQRYTLAISNSGKRIRQVQLRTTKATTASYTNLKDRVPSKFDRVKVALPEGTHDLAVVLLEPAGASAEIHAQIPQLAVGGEE